MLNYHFSPSFPLPGCNGLCWRKIGKSLMMVLRLKVVRKLRVSALVFWMFFSLEELMSSETSFYPETWLFSSRPDCQTQDKTLTGGWREWTALAPLTQSIKKTCLLEGDSSQSGVTLGGLSIFVWAGVCVFKWGTEELQGAGVNERPCCWQDIKYWCIRFHYTK